VILKRIAFSVAIIFTISPVSAETIRLATGHWPPYLDEGSEDGGFAAQIIREALATQGMEVDFDYLPWSRALMLAGTDAYDGTAIWSCTPARARRFTLSDSIIPFRFVFFHRANDPFDWQTIQDLDGKKVGLTQDYAYGKMLVKAARKGIVRTDMTTSDEANFRKLVAGRIDLFPMDPVVGKYMIRNELPVIVAGQITFDAKPLRKATYHVLFNNHGRRAEVLVETFNKGLAELKTSGRLVELVPDGLPLPETDSSRALGDPQDIGCQHQEAG